MRPFAHSSPSRSLAARVLAIAVLAVPAAAGLEAKIHAPDASAFDEFGSAVDVCEDLAVVGAPYATPPRVYVMRRVGSSSAWRHEDSLVPAPVSDGDRFGDALALCGDTIVVGAPDATGREGRVFVFDAGPLGWSQTAILRAPGGSEFDRFGDSVAFDGDTLVVGAPGRSHGLDSGSVFVFGRRGGRWPLLAELHETAPGGVLDFGRSVALDGDTLLVGSPADEATSPFSGSCWVYRGSEAHWTLEQRLIHDDGTPHNHFDQAGQSVSLDGDLALVGAPGQDSGGLNSGAAYLFEREGTTWSQVAQLLDDDGAPNESFGSAVSLERGLALVGAPGDTVGALATGTVTVHQRFGTAWYPIGELRPGVTASDGQRFGAAVKITGDAVLVGSPSDSDFGLRCGSAYVFSIQALPANLCAGKTNSLGCVPYVSFQGEPALTGGGAFVVRGEDLLPRQGALLLYGYERANLDYHGGKLCLKPPIVRMLPPLLANATGAEPCSGRVSRDFNVRIRSGADPMLTAGADVYVQWVQRDTLDPAGFGDSLTDALRFKIAP